MMIVILGNMGSGKTTVSGMLSEELNIPHYSIDICRQELYSVTPRINDSMTESVKKKIYERELKWETRAKKKLVSEILKQKDLVLETLGVSHFYSDIIERYQKLYPDEQIIAFRLYAPLTVLNKRVLSRSKAQGIVPVPQTWKCNWGNCYMSDEECLLLSVKWAQTLPTHFDPYIKHKWNSKTYSSEEIVKKIVKYIKT